MRELRVVTDSLRNKKSLGLDNIPTILWKDELFHPHLLNLCNHVFTTLECPSSWRVSGIVPVPKNSDLFDPLYYRGVSLTAIAWKIYNKFILNRLVPSLDPILRRNQNGFRGGRSTFSQISALRRIIEEMRNANREMTLIFVDFKKTFDSVDRQAMFKILTSRPVRNSTRNSQYHQSALYRHQGKSVNLWWWNWHFWYCVWYSPGWHTSTVLIYHRPRLRSANFPRCRTWEGPTNPSTKEQTPSLCTCHRSWLCGWS